MNTIQRQTQAGPVEPRPRKKQPSLRARVIGIIAALIIYLCRREMLSAGLTRRGRGQRAGPDRAGPGRPGKAAPGLGLVIETASLFYYVVYIIYLLWQCPAVSPVIP